MAYMSWTVDMGRYGGGRGKKMPKIGDLLYGWPLGLIYTKLPFCIFRTRNLFLTCKILIGTVAD